VSRRAPRPISNALERLSNQLEPASTLGRIQAVWEDAVGPAVASSARPSAERDGVLTVLCEAAVWAHELELMSDQLTERLNAALGAPALRGLRCRVG
jgi:predicted nucleic acid-binding Zn ribbon protein